MRYGKVLIPSKQAVMMQSEAQFYQIELDLSEIIEKQKQKNLIIYVETKRYDENSLVEDIEINGKLLRNEYKS